MRTMPVLLATVALMACSQGADDGAARDTGESGAAADRVVPPDDSLHRDSSTGRPDTTPAAAKPSAGDDTSRYKRPERRPIREIPPLTRPDTTTPP